MSGRTWDVHEGAPSWHQQRAGAISAGITTGFKSREDAEAFVARLKSHHPNMPVFVLEHPATPHRGAGTMSTKTKTPKPHRSCCLCKACNLARLNANWKPKPRKPAPAPADGGAK